MTLPPLISLLWIALTPLWFVLLRVLPARIRQRQRYYWLLAFILGSLSWFSLLLVAVTGEAILLSGFTPDVGILAFPRIALVFDEYAWGMAFALSSFLLAVILGTAQEETLLALWEWIYLFAIFSLGVFSVLAQNLFTFLVGWALLDLGGLVGEEWRRGTFSLERVGEDQPAIGGSQGAADQFFWYMVRRFGAVLITALAAITARNSFDFIAPPPETFSLLLLAIWLRLTRQAPRGDHSSRPIHPTVAVALGTIPLASLLVLLLRMGAGGGLGEPSSPLLILAGAIVLMGAWADLVPPKWAVPGEDVPDSTAALPGKSPTMVRGAWSAIGLVLVAALTGGVAYALILTLVVYLLATLAWLDRLPQPWHRGVFTLVLFVAGCLVFVRPVSMVAFSAQSLSHELIAWTIASIILGALAFQVTGRRAKKPRVVLDDEQSLVEGEDLVVDSRPRLSKPQMPGNLLFSLMGVLFLLLSYGWMISRIAPGAGGAWGLVGSPNYAGLREMFGIAWWAGLPSLMGAGLLWTWYQRRPVSTTAAGPGGLPRELFRLTPLRLLNTLFWRGYRAFEWLIHQVTIVLEGQGGILWAILLLFLLLSVLARTELGGL